MIAPKGPRAMRKLTRFFPRDHRNTHGYWAEYLFDLHTCNRPVLRSCPERSLQSPLFCPTHLPSATETSILLHFFACAEIIFAHILVSPRVPQRCSIAMKIPLQSTACHFPRNYLKNVTLKNLFFWQFYLQSLYVFNLLHCSRQTSSRETLIIRANDDHQS